MVCSQKSWKECQQERSWSLSRASVARSKGGAAKPHPHPRRIAETGVSARKPSRVIVRDHQAGSHLSVRICSRRCTFSYYPAQPQGLLCEALLTRHWFGIEVKITTHALDSVQRNVGENLELIYNIAAFTLFLVFTSQPQ
jgi:hypothetical protein